MMTDVSFPSFLPERLIIPSLRRYRARNLDLRLKRCLGRETSISGLISRLIAGYFGSEVCAAVEYILEYSGKCGVPFVLCYSTHASCNCACENYHFKFHGKNL